MYKDVLQRIENSNESVIIFDIDGTLKDLCKEHENAIKSTLAKKNVGNVQSKIIITLNNIAMSMVKLGLFPTNNVMQRLLVYAFSLLSCVGVKPFIAEYYKNYTKQICLFEGIYDLLSSLSREKAVYFTTINHQNYNLEECGIPQKRIVHTNGIFKIAAYKELVRRLGVSKKEILIVGDNIFDDILSAKLLRVKCLLVNNYNSKLKKAICKFVNNKYLK